MKSLIIGQGKSGSSALFFSIAEELQGCARVFEPIDMTKEDLSADDVVVKKLIEFLGEEETRLFDVFDKRIFLVRDPRDSIISRLLYTVWDRKFAYDDEKLGIFIDAIREKEEDPQSKSVRELYQIMDELDGTTVIQAVKRLNKMTLDFWNEFGSDFYVFRYEDYIRGELDAVRNYLGLEIQNEVEVAEGVQRVKRKKSFGDWKAWFTADDVEFFKREFSEILEEFGYNEDWGLDPNPEILPEFSSEYVERIAKERRELHPAKK